MNKNTRRLLLFVFILLSKAGIAQQQLTLQKTVDMAVSQSPSAFQAKHRYRSSYWQFRSYKAGKLPSVSINTQLLDVNRSISRVTQESGEDVFRERSQNASSVNLNISQNLFFTGGRIYLESTLQRLDVFRETGNVTNYLSSPVNIGYVQPLFGFNSYKWDSKTQPLAYRIARNQYLQEMEQIKAEAVRKFFALATSEMQLKLAKMNYETSDTLYNISQGRYEIGSISENELLQMKLNYLDAQTTLNEARLNVEMQQNALRSFLRIPDDTAIAIALPHFIPKFDIPVEKAIQYAMKRNPEIRQMSKKLTEAQREVARAKAKRFDADLYATFGLTRDANTFEAAYRHPQDRQQLRLGVDIPIINWGQRKGQYRMAESSRKAVELSVSQQKADFRQNVYLKVKRFNMQDKQVHIAAQKDTVAMKRFQVAKNRFMIGRIDVLKLNVARQEMHQARISYVNALKDYWSFYYLMRQLTLYDFEQSQKISIDFDTLLQ